MGVELFSYRNTFFWTNEYAQLFKTLDKLTQHRVIVNKTLSPGALSFPIFRAKSKALFNIYSFLKQKIKSYNAKWQRQRKQAKKVVKNNFARAGHFFCTSKFSPGFSTFYLRPSTKSFSFIAVVLYDYNVKRPSYTFYGGNVVCVPVHVFFFFFLTLPLIFTLVAATLSLFFTTAIKFLMFFFY